MFLSNIYFFAQTSANKFKQSAEKKNLSVSTETFL